MKEEYQDRIDEYLLERMSDDERRRFEADVEADAELKDQLEFSRRVQQAARRASDDERREAMRQWKDDYEWQSADSGSDDASDSPKVRPFFSRRMAYWVSGVAAAFIIGILALPRLLFSSSDTLSLPPLESSYMRSGSDYNEIERLLREKRYDDALTQIGQEMAALSAEWREIAQDTTISQEQRDYELTIVNGKSDDLLWLELYALCGTGHTDEAITLLGQIRSKEGTYQAVADSLYSQIKK